MQLVTGIILGTLMGLLLRPLLDLWVVQRSASEPANDESPDNPRATM